MKNKIIFFSIDRLGDYLIRSNVINKISEYYNYKEIICSDKNFKLINKKKHFNKINLFNNEKKLFNKIKYFGIFFFSRYEAAIVFDGKSISNILLIFIRAKFKYTFIYKKKGLVNNFFFIIKKIFLKICDVKFTILNSRDLIELGNTEHYPTKYKELKRYYSNINNRVYHLNDEKILNYNNELRNYILIHLDEKFMDIKNIKDDLENSIELLSQKTKKRVIISSFNNNHDYYKDLKIPKIKFSNVDFKEILDTNIIIIENIPLSNFYYFIKNSYINISCHSGFMIHTSLLLNKNCIDIMNKKDEKWLNTWTTITKNYNKLYKSNTHEIFNLICNIINEK